MKNLQVIEHQNQRVLTTAQLAEGYGTETNNIVKNYSRNSERFIPIVHYFKLEGEELREFKEMTNCHVAQKINVLYLWTEKGALLHAKSLNTDKAWEVYEMLVDTYFRSKEMFNVPKSLPEALRMAAELAERIEKQKPLIAFAETVARSEDSILIRELAKLCCDDGIKIGQNKLYEKLRQWKMIFRNSTEPYQEYIDRDYFEVYESAKETSKGVKIFKTTRVKPKGQIYIINKLKKEA